MTKLGLCGTGKMGTEIAKRLLDCNQELFVWNRTASKAQLLTKEGAKHSLSMSELVKDADIIFVIMGDDFALDYVYKDKEGLENQDLTNKTIIELSTTSVNKIQSLEKIVNTANGNFIECPIGGSTKPARDGNLLGLVGSTKDNFIKTEHLLKLICRRYEYLGAVGKGAAMKLAMNLPLMVYWQALGEAMTIATNCDINFDKALDIMMDSSGAAKVAHLKASSILQGMKNENNLSSSFSISSSLKDINLMIEEGKKYGNELHVIKSAALYPKEAVDKGWGDHDASLTSVYINKKFN